MVNGVGGYGGFKMAGLASGLDTDDIIKKMLAGQQAKIDKTKQEREQIQWKQETYRDIIKDTKDLQNTYFDIMSKDNLSTGNGFYDYGVKSSNESIITASAGQGAVEGNYKVKVEQLATGARASKKLEKATKSSKLSDVGISKDDFNIKVGDKSFKVKGLSDDSTVSDLVNAIKNAKVIEKDEQGNEKYGEEKLSKYVDVSFSEISKDFIIETKETGKEQSIEISSPAFYDAEGVKPDQVYKPGETYKLGLFIGKDAELEITTPQGGTGNITNAKNNFTIDGIAFNLKGADKDKEINLNVTKDVDKTLDRFKEFMNKYNSLVEKVNGKLTEKKNYKYKPLTEEQKKDMKEDDIKKWEAKAKEGILKNDKNLERMLSELRKTFFSKVDGSGESFGRRMGLDTTNDYKTAGQIKFAEGGEEKFKKALLERPDDIMELFTKKADKDDIDNLTKLQNLSKSKEITDDQRKELIEVEKRVYNNSGIFTRMDSIFKNYVGAPGTTLNSSILTKYANKQEDYSLTGTVASNNLPDQVYRKDNLIKELDKKLRSKEERLYKQFATLEKAMTKYNAQAGWLSQQFGGGM